MPLEWDESVSGEVGPNNFLEGGKEAMLESNGGFMIRFLYPSQTPRIRVVRSSSRVDMRMEEADAGGQ